MRVALDMQPTLGQKTGIGIYALNLFNELKHVAPQHTYLNLAWGNDAALRTDQRLMWQQVRMPRMARQEQADILHVTGFDAPWSASCPVVLTVHDLIGLLFPDNLPPLERLYWQRWLPASVGWASHIIVISQNTKQDVENYMHVDPQRITVVPQGVDAHFKPIEDTSGLDALRQHYKLPETFMLYLGTMEPSKGLDTLVKAYAQIHKEVPALVIAGKKGHFTRPLFKLVEQLGVQDKVIFTDYIPDEHVVGMLNLASVFVFPSRYEGFGLPPLEAMACGTPVVCSSSSSLPEVVGDAAATVPPDEPDALAQTLLEVLNDPDEQAALRQKGLARAREFSWEKTARATAAVYEAVAQ